VLQVTALAGRANNGQSLLDWHTVLWIWHNPVTGQLLLLVQDAPPTWQVPGTVGQPALDVQTVLLWTLQ